MVRQTVPDLDLIKFTLNEIPDLFKENRIKINYEYQRGDVWKPSQKIELIRSIFNSFSIGILVSFYNDDKQHEILDGQQRLLTIKQYLDGKLDLSKTDIPLYSELSKQDQTLLNAYCVFSLNIRFSQESKEENLIQTFLRLQEGTPLNKAEKINAYRGKFKETFRQVRETHKIFEYLGKDKRFRLRQLSAEMLLEHISKIGSDKNNNASQMNESEVILKKTIIANQNAAVVLQPSKQALHFPSPAIAT